MTKLAEILSNKGDNISLKINTKNDILLEYEIKKIINNSDFYIEIINSYVFSEECSIDTLLIYILSNKISELILFDNLDESSKLEFERVRTVAQKNYKQFNKSDIIRYINQNFREIFSYCEMISDLDIAIINIIAEYQSGIKEEVYQYIAENFGYLLLNNYSSFEKQFFKNPDLFEIVFNEEIFSFHNINGISDILEIFLRIIESRKPSLISIIDDRINFIINNFEMYLDCITNFQANIQDNLLIDTSVTQFYDFLVKAKRPEANTFGLIVEEYSRLMDEYIETNGQLFKYEIPVEIFKNIWKDEKNSKTKLLMLSHKTQGTDINNYKWISKLSEYETVEDSLLDLISVNIPTDSFFTYTHQQNINVQLNLHIGWFIGIISESLLLEEYIQLIKDAFPTISQHFCNQRNEFEEVFGLFLASISDLKYCTNEISRLNFYNTILLGCTLIEKMLRTLFIEVNKDIEFISQRSIMLGKLLSEDNTSLSEILGTNHHKHLADVILKS
ncbi:hypothetical protein ASN88_01172 [Streptococcus parauberis]|uniref:hypothetical protein n=1 Tax=Streptococcus parauberis TaxID=1348 RepID=UPI000CCDC3D3|nr:hypothetical protein [Streptococcus parauberis]PNY21504.1 hypothetical protein ASN88_01172 [Streptococcus parauberis]